MDNWFNSKWFVRAVSLAFAILLSVFVHFESSSTQSDSRVPSKTNKVETLYDIPLHIKIDSDRYVVSGVPETVNVSLEGTTSVLTPIVMQRNIELFVDLRDKEEGSYTVDIEHEKIPSELSVYIDPKTIDVDIEERATEQFPISVDFIDEDKLPVGYELGEAEVKPEVAEVTSAKSVMEQIGIVKVYIDVADLDESVNNREVPINVYDNQGNALSVKSDPESAVVSVDVDNPSKTVPINVTTTGELAEEFDISSMTPKLDEIEIFATNATLESIDELSTEEIDLSEVTESGTMDVAFDLPEGVVVSEENETIEIEIELEQTRTIDDVPIEIEDQAGQDVSFSDPENGMTNLTVSGLDKDVSELTAEDFRLFVETDGLTEGVHEVPVLIESPDDVDVETEIEEVTIEVSS